MNKNCGRSSRWAVLYKKGVFFQVSILWALVEPFWTKGLFSRESYSYVILSKIRTDLSLQEFRWSGARNKLKTGVLPRIFNHSTEYLDLPDHCICLPASSLRIRKNASIFPGNKQKGQRSTSIFSAECLTSALLFSTEQLFF